MPKPSPWTTFDVHPGVAMVQQWIETLEDKTGKPLDGWMKHIRAHGPKDEKATRAWLKDEHNLGTNTAWWLAERAHGNDLSLRDDSPERYLALAPKYAAGQYAGKKEALRPIYEALVLLARKKLKDVRVCPCETIVPLYRTHVIAQIKPSTNTRVDFGLALGPMVKAGKKLPARLVDTGGFAKKDRVTHRIELTSPSQVDAFVERWLVKAWALDG
ncbi:MAG: hypothetical protein HBSAPP03_28970 [Phycisphaerae bacterium]|nr:MAG: hypothetical protein HBSAPP03_28970 [Phycisphaerae bacterium]